MAKRISQVYVNFLCEKFKRQQFLKDLAEISINKKITQTGFYRACLNKLRENPQKFAKLLGIL